jgi:hypothetical protein
VEFGAEIFHRLFPRKTMRYRRALLLQRLKRHEDSDIVVFVDCAPRHAWELGAATQPFRLLDGGQPLSEVDQDWPFLQSLTKLLRWSSSVHREGDRRLAGIIDKIDL